MRIIMTTATKLGYASRHLHPSSLLAARDHMVCPFFFFFFVAPKFLLFSWVANHQNTTSKQARATHVGRHLTRSTYHMQESGLHESIRIGSGYWGKWLGSNIAKLGAKCRLLRSTWELPLAIPRARAHTSTRTTAYRTTREGNMCTSGFDYITNLAWLAVILL